MGVPYTFASATNSIPLSQLDANFNTPVTIGSTTVGLGNTVSTLTNVTLSNATITSVSTPITVPQGGTGLTTLTAGYIPYGNGTGAFSSNANLTVDIYNNFFVNGLRLNGTDGSFNQIYQSNASKALGLTALSGPLIFSPNSTEAMRITTSGVLGLGTSSPNGSMEIYGGNTNLYLTTTVGSSYTVLEMRNTATGGYAYQVGLGGPSASPANAWYVYDANNAAVRFTIDSSGGVGVGVNNPSSYGKLAVNGAVACIASPTSFSIDSSSQTVTISAGQSVAFPNFSGILVVTETVASGQTAILGCGGGATAVFSQTSNLYITASTAGYYRWWNNGSVYTLTNNTSGTVVWGICAIRTRTGS